MVERRRCKRVPLAIPVRVYGRTPTNHPFRAVTATMDVSLHGGLLEIRSGLELGKNILVVNSFTEEQRECRVVYVGSRRRGLGKVAVEFASADGDFWHVYSPPVQLKATQRS